MKGHWRQLIYLPDLLRYLSSNIYTVLRIQKWEAKLKGKQSWWKLSKLPSKFFATLGIFMCKTWKNWRLGCQLTMSLPKRSHSVNSFEACDDEDLGQLVPVASTRIIEGKLQPNGMARSYSLCVWKIGRIEEDNPCALRQIWYFIQGVGSILLREINFVHNVMNRA